MQSAVTFSICIGFEYAGHGAKAEIQHFQRCPSYQDPIQIEGQGCLRPLTEPFIPRQYSRSFLVNLVVENQYLNRRIDTLMIERQSGNPMRLLFGEKRRNKLRASLSIFCAKRQENERIGKALVWDLFKQVI